MPSAAILEKKKQLVSELTEKLKEACAGVIVQYEGISVEGRTPSFAASFAKQVLNTAL